MPGCWVPVRVVITLLWTLETVPVPSILVPVRVLPRGCGTAVVPHVLISRVQPLVPFTSFASQVVVQRLVLPQARVGGRGGLRRLGLPACRVLVATLRAIPEARVVVLGHVLEDHLAAHIALPKPTAMLHVPLHIELRALIEGHHALHCTPRGCIVVAVTVLADRSAVVTNLVARLIVVLRVEDAVCIVHRVALLGKLVVGASRVVQVDVSLAKREQPHSEEDGEEGRAPRAQRHQLRMA
mmetsp:Transcript_51188/g.146141  ORF Transcript_51188/g.146141 Transcript_51188/m.146141 type:complete len:240 (+) Transcript_51188:477-1196(+)